LKLIDVIKVITQ